ncbi:TolC family protein [Novosphingobium guangzhouense]|uniref:Metal transporter n=1 Tax=Novosphingobium guangzhouense TaxID=1850347 RepID=A0A2K2G3S0_9SPHN|nr:TolC family protein [Novosphingobium guangzhouense]PNU05689.1 metal transporter [Novosphingobium guangzhouense]
MSDPVGSWRPRRALTAMASIGWALAAASAPAQTAPPFAQLYNDTRNAPHQIALDAEVDRAEGLARQAQARPNPTLSVMTENVAGQSPYRGFDRSENTLQVNQAIEIGGKRSSRIAAGTAGVVAANARTRDARLAYAYDLAIAYGAAEIADRRIELAEDEVDEASADMRAVRALVQAGKEARLRRLQVETEVNALRALVDAARAERVGAYARLAALAGEETGFTDLAEPLLPRFETKTGYGPIDPLQTAPYLAAKAERDAARQRVSAARRQANPDLTVSVGVRRLETDKANALIAGLSVPLPLFDRNRGNVDAAEADLRAAEARDAGTLLNVKAEIAAALALNEAADARMAAADRTLLTAQEAYRLARIAYEAGKSPLLELLAARHVMGAARGVVLDAAAARLEARARLAHLDGTTITGEPVQ